MRSLAIAALGAALLLGCNDDEEDQPAGDAAIRPDGSTVDAGVVDSGSLDATTPRDASLDASNVSRATATLISKSNSNVTGNATFTVVGNVVTLNVAVSGATPGEHGIHIHEKPDCSAADATSAGGHWNPSMQMHGAPDAGASSHLGDLGNILIGANGTGTLSISKPEWTLGTGAITDVLHHSIVVHANEDDLVTQAGDAGPGNSGSRQACGEIEPG